MFQCTDSGLIGPCLVHIMKGTFGLKYFHTQVQPIRRQLTKTQSTWDNSESRLKTWRKPGLMTAPEKFSCVVKPLNIAFLDSLGTEAWSHRPNIISLDRESHVLPLFLKYKKPFISSQIFFSNDLTGTKPSYRNKWLPRVCTSASTPCLPAEFSTCFFGALHPEIFQRYGVLASTNLLEANMQLK